MLVHPITALVPPINNPQLLKDKKHRAEEAKKAGVAPSTDADKEDKVITIRPLNMADFKEAKKQVKRISLYLYYRGLLTSCIKIQVHTKMHHFWLCGYY